VHHRGALTGQAIHLVRVDPDAVGEGRPPARDADRVEVGDLLQARGPEHRLALHDRLRRVGVQLGVEPVRQIARRPEQWPGAGGDEARGEARPQPAVGGAVPALGQRRRIRQRVVGRLSEVDRGAFGVRVHQAFPDRGAHADSLERPERRVGVANGLHVEDRRGAAEQQLRGAEQGGGVHRFFGVCGLERPDAARQPVLQPQVVGEPAEQRLAEMHVGLDETGHDQAAAAVTNLGRGAGGPRPPSLVSLPHLPDRLNSPVAHRHVRPHHAPGAVVQQDIAAGEPHVRQVLLWGRQVVARGAALVESSGRSK